MQATAKVVGITGGIGSGKSTICKIFGLLGAPIYYADDRAKALMNNDEKVKKQIIITFGTEAYSADGTLNRSYLAQQVFNNSEQVKKLNEIVHPAVANDFEKWAGMQNHSYVIKEAALLIESGSYQSLDFLITVFSPIDLRVERVQRRDAFRSIDEIKGIISKQVSEEKRQELAQSIIKNDERHLLIPQVLVLHQQLMEL